MRYVTVGIISNCILYLLYLVFTTAGIGHKTAMTGIYPLGILQTFVFNKSWTFEYSGGFGPRLWRYVSVYVVGYLFNFAALGIFVDVFGWPHEFVQGAAILLLAVGIFLTQKYWVFADRRDGSSTNPQVPERHS